MHLLSVIVSLKQFLSFSKSAAYVLMLRNCQTTSRNCGQFPLVPLREDIENPTLRTCNIETKWRIKLPLNTYSL